MGAISIAACSEKSQGTPRDSTTTTKAPVASGGHTGSTTASCVPATSSRLRLSGIVREEHRLGPPRYGETPKRDQKITILVLALPQPIDVCADTTSDTPHPAVRWIRDLQITSHLDPEKLRAHFGREITVWGTDYTQVLIRVDSIPGLYAAPSSRVIPRRIKRCRRVAGESYQGPSL